MFNVADQSLSINPEMAKILATKYAEKPSKPAKTGGGA
jgi:hypothetical protein